MHRRSDVLLSNSEESSEVDFWQEVDGTVDSQECSAASAQCDLLNSETQLHRVRAATRTQLQNDLTLARAQVKREFWTYFEQQKRKYCEEIEKLRGNCDDLRMMGIGKDLEIGKLKGLIAEQEVLICALRLGVIITSKPLEETALSTKKTHQNIDYFKSEARVLQEKVTSFTEVVKILRSENTELTDKIADYKQELKETHDEYQEKLQCQIEVYEEKLRKSEEKYTELLSKYDFNQL